MMIRKDWSVIRITVLLYFIVLFLPINYYFVMNSFKSMENDTKTMKQLVFINGALQKLSTIEELKQQNILILKIDNSLKTIENTFVSDSQEKEYLSLFRIREVYADLNNTYKELKIAIQNGDLINTKVDKIITKVNEFSITTEEMIDYKLEVILDRLYISLAFTMIVMISLVFFIRLYIKYQIRKHAIHDHITDLYNKNYFDNVLLHMKLLATRQEKPLSLLIMSIHNYTELEKSLNKREFEKQLIELSVIFNQFFRRSDTICRIEQDCFAAITPDVTFENVKILSDKLYKELKSKYSNKNVTIELCLGVSTYNKESFYTLLKEAKKDIESCNIKVIGGLS